MGTAIVAIPREDDYVWKLSSEKIPHMTLLYLGDGLTPAETNDVVEFVKHAVSWGLHRFGLSVDRRGVLGSDEADVLFFEKGHSTEPIEKFRGQLLKNDTIFKAFSSTEQFDGWTPHLTLGYPGSPAKKDTRDFPSTSWVSFDKIAVWYGDYEGAEIVIPDTEYLEVMSMGEKAAQDFLAHFGVKGMKWGVRKQKASHPSSSDAERAKATRDLIKKHGTKSVDNKDLQHLVTRMNLEKQYNTLMEQNPGKIRKGHAFVKNALAMGKTAQEVYNLANGPLAKAVGRSLASGGSQKPKVNKVKPPKMKFGFV